LMDMQFIPQIIQLVISIVVAPILVAGCIGCLTRKPWSQGLVKIGILGSILSSVVSLGIAAWMLLFHWDKVVAPQAGQPGGEMVAMVSQAIPIGIMLITLGFFVWALIAMGNKKITAFYDSLSSARRK